MSVRVEEQAPLWERLAGRRYQDCPRTEHVLIGHRLRQWKRALNDVDEHLLSARCELAGHTLSDTLQEFGVRIDSPDHSVPASLLLSGASHEPSSKSVEGIPFGDILEPVADRALASLQRSLSSEERALFSPLAFECLKINLLDNLSFISHHALLNEFNISRSSLVVAGLHREKTAEEPPRAVYEAFRSSLASDGGARFYRNYPVIQRLFALKVTQWKRSTRSIIKHVKQDKGALNQEFGIERTELVDHITVGLSDPHRGGRTVAILRFSSGKRVVYKPRGLSLESGFSRIISHLNRAIGSEVLRTFRMIDRREHGWCEFVEGSRLTGEDEIKEFFYRSGALLAVLYAIRATDCHFENVLCWSGFPVLIDLETLCHQDNNLLFDSADIKGVAAPFFHSVTRIGFLPAVRNDPDAMELSPLAPEAIEPQHMSRMYEHQGTDLMRLAEVSEARAIPTIVDPQHSVPHDTIVRELKRGFTDSYVAIVSSKENLLENGDLLPSLRKEESRFVARNTQLYGWLSQKSLEFHLLRSGVDRSIELESLFRGALQGPKRVAWFKVAEAERKSLERLDIPHFTTRLSDRHIRSDGKIVARNVFERTPMELVTDRIQSMSVDDLNSQLALIEMLFAQKNPGPMVPRPVPPRGRPSTESAILAACDDVATRIWSHRVLQKDGSPTWLTLHPLLKGGRYKVMPGGVGLYHGSAGIGLYYAAHFAGTGSESSKVRSLAAFGSALEADTVTALLDNGRIDIGEGISGIAYALIKGSDLLGDPELGRKGVELLTRIPEGRIVDGGNAMCVVSGLAGLLLALDVANRSCPSKYLRDRMRIVAEVIVNQASSVSGNVSAWSSPAGEVLSGFAHGSVGIAYSLSRAGQTLGDEHARTMARHGFQHAINAYDESVSNWVEGRSQVRGDVTACSWCHGALGVGLGLSSEHGESLEGVTATRARVLEVLHKDLEKGPPTQSLCCGTAGALELLLNFPKGRISDSLSNGIVDSLLDTDAHRCTAGNSAGVFMPGLFNGSAGLAYQLLRFSSIERIPSVLLFE
jgi:type 2 lantibiotic biosynthesis protein LanM